MDLSVIVPCYNEAQNIGELVERVQNTFRKKNIKGEIVLVNDGSRDNTGEIIDSCAAKHENVVAVHHEVNRGMEAGWRSGLKAAQGHYVCLIDADLQNLPEDIARLYREITITGADMVQGWRSHVGRLKDSRFILSKGLNFILNTLFGMHQRDNKSGFVICQKEVLVDILRHRYNYHYYQTFITVAAAAKGYYVRQIETLFESRLVGKSFMPKLPVKVILFTFMDLAKALVEFRLRCSKDTVLEDFLEHNPATSRDEPLALWRRLYFKFYLLLMPLHHWMISYDAGRYLDEVRTSQWLPHEKVKELQSAKLKKLLQHAYNHVPYYREMFDRLNLKPKDIKTVDDLVKLPTTSKKDVRDNLYFDMMSDNHDKRRILKITTSGSTGEPFVCYADKSQLEIRWATTVRNVEWTGYRFGDRQVRLWHATLGMTKLQVFREKLDALLCRRKFLSVFDMTERNLPTYVKVVEEYKPVLFDGYAEAFNFLARYFENKLAPKLQLKGMISSAQMLPNSSREIIEKQFGCKVFDKYGSREFSGIAHECEAHTGHHVNAESYIVEILKDGRPALPDEMGEVVVTDLNNYCMPLIRYRLGDLAVAMDGRCPCGRGLPLIGEIMGRVQSMIIGTEGHYLPGAFFPHFLKDYVHAIQQFQVVQTEQGSVTLKVVKAPRFTQETLDEVIKVLKDHLGKSMQINVEFVNEIPLVRTGKHLHSVSKLDIDFQKVSS